MPTQCTCTFALITCGLGLPFCTYRSQTLELRMTDATNEAKDNVRYLASLESSLEVRLRGGGLNGRL